MISRITTNGVCTDQISNWFINARRRKLPEIQRNALELQRRQAETGVDGEQVPESDGSTTGDVTTTPRNSKKRAFEEEDDSDIEQQEETMRRAEVDYTPALQHYGPEHQRIREQSHTLGPAPIPAAMNPSEEHHVRDHRYISHSADLNNPEIPRR